jgi:4a-hydroxytetrahydrobiopterin dehydratase
MIAKLDDAAITTALDGVPGWTRNGGVEIRLTTHDAGGLSVRDFALAKAIDG